MAGGAAGSAGAAGSLELGGPFEDDLICTTTTMILRAEDKSAISYRAQPGLYSHHQHDDAPKRRTQLPLVPRRRGGNLGSRKLLHAGRQVALGADCRLLDGDELGVLAGNELLHLAEERGEFGDLRLELKELGAPVFGFREGGEGVRRAGGGDL